MFVSYWKTKPFSLIYKLHLYSSFLLIVNLRFVTLYTTAMWIPFKIPLLWLIKNGALLYSSVTYVAMPYTWQKANSLISLFIPVVYHSLIAIIVLLWLTFITVFPYVVPLLFIMMIQPCQQYALTHTVYVTTQRIRVDGRRRNAPYSWQGLQVTRRYPR